METWKQKEKPLQHTSSISPLSLQICSAREMLYFSELLRKGRSALRSCSAYSCTACNEHVSSLFKMPAMLSSFLQTL